MTDLVSPSRNTGAPTVSTLLTFLIAAIRGYTHFTAEHGDEAAARLASTFAAITSEIATAHDGRVLELRGGRYWSFPFPPRSAWTGRRPCMGRGPWPNPPPGSAPGMPVRC